MQDLAVEPVQAALVHLEQLERCAGGLRRHDPLHAYLSEVTHALEQAIGNSGGAPAAPRDRERASIVETDLENARRAPDDRRELSAGVRLQPSLDAEAVAQGRRQEACARRRPDERERRKLERHDASAGAGSNCDRQPVVLHRRVEGLLERSGEAVNLVHEEHAPRLERRQEGSDVALALERGSGGLHEGNLELGGEDLGERGLAEPRRAGKQHVIECLAARTRGLERHRELLPQGLLPHEVIHQPWAQRAIELVLGDEIGRLHARGLAAHRGPAHALACAPRSASEIS